MSLHVDGDNLADAWVNAYDALSAQPGRQTVHLTVTIGRPNLEVLGVRQAVDRAVATLRAQGKTAFNKSVHTVANTIFPISLYREGRPDAFYEAALSGQSGRQGSVTSWGPKAGTYIGRLLNYPTYKGTIDNQLARMLRNLDAEKNYQDFYEISLLCECSEAELSSGVATSASTFVPGSDNSHRGGQCLSHVSLTRSPDGALSMAALYRHQTYLTRAYGNFLGLARLLHFLAHESSKDLHVGELMIVASHAEIESDARAGAPDLLAACRQSLDDEPVEIEWQNRPFGAKWSDLDLPEVST